MPDSIPPFQYVYRRVPPDYIEQGESKDTAFYRSGEDKLSVIMNDGWEPINALTHYIACNEEVARKGTGKAQERALKNLEKFPDEKTMFEKGWRVVKLPLEALSNCGIVPHDEPDMEQFGHLNLVATTGANAFRDHAKDWAREYKPLDEEATLRNPERSDISAKGPDLNTPHDA